MVSRRVDWPTQTFGRALTPAKIEIVAQWCAIPAGGVITVLDIVLLGFVRFLLWRLVGPGWFRWGLWWLDHLTGAVDRCVSSWRGPFPTIVKR